ncbi:MAG: hypothetical protein Q4C45_04255, partial [Oscillospiraceae bacterium]|nr:hypothetical protein [Oscillospiraceae bacterium]
FLLFRAMKIPLSTKKATVQTVASDNIIPYVIFRFRERKYPYPSGHNLRGCFSKKNVWDSLN